MERHFDQELAALKQDLLRMSSLAEQSVAKALKALVDRDNALAEQVDAEDTALDRLQVEIDNRAIKLLALRQPTAKDLRFIMMATKLTTDLERIGDQAVNIARRALLLNREPQLRPFVNTPRMAEIARGMIRDVFDAFVYEKPARARDVIGRDAELDRLDRQVHADMTEAMVANSGTVTRAIHIIAVAHNLERIGDHATNIAEEIIFLYEGHDIRHQHD